MHPNVDSFARNCFSLLVLKTLPSSHLMLGSGKILGFRCPTSLSYPHHSETQISACSWQGGIPSIPVRDMPRVLHSGSSKAAAHASLEPTNSETCGQPYPHPPNRNTAMLAGGTCSPSATQPQLGESTKSPNSKSAECERRWRVCRLLRPGLTQPCFSTSILIKPRWLRPGPSRSCLVLTCATGDWA